MPVDLSILDQPQRSASEQQMAQLVRTTPEEDAYDAQVEANPAYDDELNRQMNSPDSQTIPQQLALQDEQATRAQAAVERTNQSKPKVDLSSLSSGVDLSALDTPKEKHSKYIQNLIDAFDRMKNQGEQANDTMSPLDEAKGVATGIAKGFNQGLLGIIGSVERGATAANSKFLGLPDLPEKYQVDKADWAKRFSEPNNPAEQVGAQGVGLPFAPITAGIDMLPKQYQQNAQDTINILSLGIPELARKSPTPEVPIETPPELGSVPNVPQSSLSRGPAPLEDQITTHSVLSGEQMPENIQTSGSPEIPPSGPSTGPFNNEPAPGLFTDRIAEQRNREGTDAYVPYELGRTGDLLGTEQVGQNPFLRQESLTPDENGIMRDKGLSTDVQREAYDIPAVDDLLKTATDHIAEQQERATPETQDSINAQQQALWDARERHERNKASEAERMWRDYEADTLVQRLPALKESLENPLGNNRDSTIGSRVTPNPDLSGRPISNVGGLNRQRGAIDMSDLNALVDKFKGWFSKDDLKAVPDGHLAEVSTALYRKYTPDVEMGENRQGRMGSLEDSRGKMPIPQLSVEKLGDKWTVYNHDGRHRSDTLLKDGVSKMPVRVMGDVEDFLRENPKTIRSQDMQTELPNPWYKMEAGPNPIDPNGIYSEAPHYDGRPKIMQEADRAVRTGNPNFGKFRQGGGISPGVFLPDWLTKKAKGSPIADEILQFERRSGIQWLEDIAKDPKIKDEDSASQLGLSSGSWRATTPAIKDPYNSGNRSQLFINNSIQAALSDLHIANQAIQTAMTPFLKHYGIGSAKLFDIKTLRKDLRTVLRMEGGEGWDPSQNKWPTISDMVSNGMSPKSAQVWSNMHSLSYGMWDTLKKSAQMTGIPVPPWVPGWVPHMFKGPYKVRIYNVDEAGNKKFVGTYGEYTLKAAQDRLEAMKGPAESHGFTIDIEKPQPGRTTASELFKGLWEAKDKLEQNKGLQSLLQSMYESSAQGLVSNVLKRTSPTMLGHEFERIVSDKDFTVARAKDALNSYHETFKDINSWYNRVKFVNEKLFPLDAAGVWKDKPNALRNVQAWVQQYMEIPDRIAPEIDRWIQDKLVRKGWDPQTIFAAMGRTNSAFATAYLLGNVKYYLANRLQSTIAPGFLYTKNLIDGGRGSIAKAIMRGSLDVSRLNSQLNIPILKEAQKRGFLDPSYIDEMKVGRWKDPIAQAIETRTRSEAFLYGWHYYSQYLPREKAIEAAGKFTDEISVNYHRSFGQPNVIARLPQAGRPIALFASFNQHMLGLANQSIQVAARQGVTGGRIIQAAGSILAVQGMLMAMYGINGLPFANNIQAINEWLNKNYNIDFGTPQDWVHTWKTSPIFRKIAEFGLPSTLIDADISTSGQGASIQMPTAYINMFANLKDLAVAAAKWATDETSRTKESVWEQAQKFPPMWRGVSEHFIKGDWGDVFAGIPTKKPGKEGIHSFDSLRTPSENILNTLGVNSTDQAERTLEDRQFNRLSRDMGGNRTDAMKSYLEGNHIDKSISKFIQNAGDPNSLESQIIKYKMEQNVSSPTREAMKAKSGGVTAAKMFQKYLEIHGNGLNQ